MKLIDLKLSLDQLLLDPNNYRLDYDSEPKSYKDKDIVDLQIETQEKLEKENLGILRESILRNGFLEMDRIVVRELRIKKKTPLYVVVEGNRRTAAFKSIIEEYENEELNIENKLIKKSKSISVVCIIGTLEEIKDFASGLMGIRHVSGQKKWTGYQSARLIDDLYNDGKSLTEIGSLLGISSRDAGRRLRGYRAFIQMRKDKIYGKSSEPNHYTLLLEFLSPSKYGKKWLGWNDEEFLFKNKNNLERLYSALTTDEDYRPEINNPNDARLFLKHLEDAKHRSLIEDWVALEDLPPLTENKNKIIKQLNNFLFILEEIEEEDLDENLIETLRNIYSAIEEIIGD